ncbi:Glycerophosphoryl diester phosphodiesterase [Rhodoblastus acidophilus]|uniref:Glycerophosphoryl diester phosphodiesterase n=1 Tax=Rhodoblastus acidophilus TaxID=1074 RepID=A0A212RGQ5_RHOAC|nr:glycerophosphodiester phosphodiesterase family protein [Rhodoblastus acidophilus]PPQ39592.1 glycerophosphodiester phosphodiesterase [Rhodoblastus acidophilus]RAI24375.1 glycerophosphodiester phosphodiesterase [Rhodoblastus acidophilus]SNB71544.1 Glycerophosphoryl diester phosphodiesterase [Rhodoblastus acidophilus]
MTAPDWLTARPIAHRGLHDRDKPENSLAALRPALARGYGVEADIRLSRDGEIFVFHDDDLARLTGAEGAFRRRDAADLAGLRLADGTPIPTLAAFLRAAQGATPLILELKSDFDGDLSLARATQAALAGYDGPVALKSFDPALIAALRAGTAVWPLGVVAQADYEEDEDFAALAPEAKDRLARFVHAGETRPDFLSWRCGDLPNAVCELARACAQMPVISWTVRSAAQAAQVLRHADQIVFEGFAP